MAPLDDYRARRDFARTPEPAGGEHAAGPAREDVAQVQAGAAAESSSSEPRQRLYVIQKHAATRLHYDFRLELDGVLLSWAVPKGPSLDPRDRRLAVRTEDHPLEYGSFEGTIPKGEYGAGTVLLWDLGTWEPVGDPHKGLAKGDLKFQLRGRKLRGGWVLARMRSRPGEEAKENWLLIKHRDEQAVDGEGRAVLDRRPESVVSGRSLEQIASEAQGHVWHGDRPPEGRVDGPQPADIPVDPSRLFGARRAAAPPPRFVPPQLATLVKTVPSGDGWLHEIKLDGYRALARLTGRGVEIYSRNEKDWTDRYLPIAESVAALPAESAVLDGEVVVQLPDGTTSFRALQDDLAGGRTGRLLYYVFDLVHLNGWDLTGVRLEGRKTLLQELLTAAPAANRLRYTEHVVGRGDAFFKQACRLGLEGIVSKRADSAYRPGFRGGDWLKVKCVRHEEFVVGGFTDPSGARRGFGALLLGTHGPEGKLRYVSRVGTGFNERMLRELSRRLAALKVAVPPFELGLERAPKGAHWVRPELVAEVAFTEWTADGGIRHPSFRGLREDKSAGEVSEEREASPPPQAPPRSQVPLPPAPAVPSPPRKGVRPARRASGLAAGGGVAGGGAAGRLRHTLGETEVLGVRLTNPGRVFWPADGLTKLDLVRYYQAVADHMLPYILHRPVAMVRCPEGVGGVEPQGRGGACFFHKHPGRDFPGPVERMEILESGGLGDYLALGEVAGLMAMAQMGVLEIHIWGSTWPDIKRPDLLVFDLDPDPAVGWAGLVEGAHLVRDLLQGLGLVSFVKTTGGKGLHVAVPLMPGEDWEGVKRFAKAVADAIVKAAPERYTSNVSKAKRAGKTFVDYLRNARGATAIAPFSPRARAHATVAVPLRWDELGGRARPDSYTVRNLRRRLAHLQDDPWAGYFQVQRTQTITEPMKRALGIA